MAGQDIPQKAAEKAAEHYDTLSDFWARAAHDTNDGWYVMTGNSMGHKTMPAEVDGAKYDVPLRTFHVENFYIRIRL